MAVDFLRIHYDRIVGTQEVILNDNNYQEYGYLKDENGYYLYDSELKGNVYYDKHDVDIVKKFSHTLLPPSNFDITYADVDREGSGRNESDGQMIRERIGHYQSINVTWNVVQNDPQSINLVRVLKSLPPSFTLEYHDIEEEYNTFKSGEFYRGDISYDLYLFIEKGQVWKGLATTFIQYDVTPYDDSQEPTLIK